jgi:hypothetical protein
MSDRGIKRRRVRLQMADKKPSPRLYYGEFVEELVPRIIVTRSPLRGMSEIARKVRARGGDPTAFDELKAAAKSFQDAADGDTAALRERLRRGELTLDECQLAADLLTPGKIVRPAHKPAEQRIKDKRALARRSLLEWLKAGEPEILDADEKPISILEAMQQQFGQRGLSRTVVLGIIAELRKQVALSAQ